MATKKKKDPRTVSDNYRPEVHAPTTELVLRECFLRMAKETMDCWGVDKYSVERIQGALALLEEFNNLNE